MLIHKTIVEQHRDKKGDVLFRSIGVVAVILLAITFILGGHLEIGVKTLARQ
jgi:hypothetical protein